MRREILFSLWHPCNGWCPQIPPSNGRSGRYRIFLASRIGQPSARVLRPATACSSMQATPTEAQRGLGASHRVPQSVEAHTARLRVLPRTSVWAPEAHVDQRILLVGGAQCRKTPGNSSLLVAPSTWATTGREQSQQPTPLFDHLVGAAKQRDGKSEAQCPDGLEAYQAFVNLDLALTRSVVSKPSLKNP